MPNPFGAAVSRLSLSARVLLGGAVVIAAVAGTLTWEASRRS